MSVMGDAQHAQRLMEDTFLLSAFKRIEDDQISVFLNSEADSEAREKAHTMVCALNELRQTLNGYIIGGKFEEIKDQHRGSD